jgi:hypothetical protein
MTSVKRAVTIDQDVDREARKLAGGNFSAFVNKSLRRQIRYEHLVRLADEDSQQRGPLDADLADAVAAELRELDR